LKILFKKKKLLQKGYLSVSETVDPSCIIWENLGEGKIRKLIKWASYLIISAGFFWISLVVLWQIGRIEKLRMDYFKQDCTTLDWYTMDSVVEDLQNPYKT